MAVLQREAPADGRVFEDIADAMPHMVCIKQERVRLGANGNFNDLQITGILPQGDRLRGRKCHRHHQNKQGQLIFFHTHHDSRFNIA